MDYSLTNQYNSAHPNSNSRLSRGPMTKAARTALRLFPLLLGAVLASCDPPANSPKTYTTTVSGKIITPGLAADPSKGRSIAKAEVWSSIDPANKVLAKMDGTYSLTVTHSGSFTITANYKGRDGNYKASAPKIINTSARNIDDQDIALKYGYITSVSGKVEVFPDETNLRDGTSGTLTNNVMVIVEVEGVEVARGTTKNIGGKNGQYYIDDIPHDGTRLTIKVSFNGMSKSEDVREPGTEHITRNMRLLRRS